ncbi:MAG: DUF4214 domain-containing protein [Lachnospiraceae bacterium]|nr:DUF4214 domain-containing protein [Lachnospiraceae bacterium]
MKKTASGFTRVLSMVLSLLMILSVISIPSLKAKAAGSVDDFIERCYLVTLGRPSDKDGFKYWKDRVTNGEAVGVEVAYGFLFSSEYTKLEKKNEDYVTDLYTLFMGREPDKDGFNDWVGKLENGSSKLDVFAGFANSQEFYNLCEEYGITAGRFVKGADRQTINNVNLFVERMYKICLGRLGDRGGQNNWVEKLVAKQISGSECARSFIFSKEYTNLGLSDDDFVENLYLAIMGRPSDPEGKEYWLYALSKGMTRDEAFAGFVNSVEFDGICKKYGIDRGSYKATQIGTFNPKLDVKAGKTIKFGKYEQDGNEATGQEDIEWIVLENDGKGVFVVSKYVLDNHFYNFGEDDVTWETCTLRTWLNNDFYNAAFNDSEKAEIAMVTLENKANTYYNKPAGNNTNDKVFLLSVDEVEKYFGDYNYFNKDEQYGYNQNLICTATPYAINQGVSELEITADVYNDQYFGLKKYGYSQDVVGTKGCDWWLRGPVSEMNYWVCFVTESGNTGQYPGCNVFVSGVGVRPAMYIEY